MGETIESQPSNKLILDTCLSCSEVLKETGGVKKLPSLFWHPHFSVPHFSGYCIILETGPPCERTLIITRNKFVRSINSLLYFHRP